MIDTIFSAPLASILVVAGIVFLFVAVLGTVAGKIDPGKEGRIAVGAIGGVLLVIGLSMHLVVSKRANGEATAHPPLVVERAEEAARRKLEEAALRTAQEEAARRQAEAAALRMAEEEAARRQAEAAKQRQAAIPAFPWPPPRASAEYQIRNKWVSDGAATKLSAVANRIEAALAAANYELWRYSSVPRGFALLTQIEQILPDGTPRPASERFRADLPSYAHATFAEFLRALAIAPPGRYRLIVFIVTDVPFAQTRQQPSEQEARDWIGEGVNRLPKIIGVLPYEDGYGTTALIYEFQKTSPSEPMKPVVQSRISGRDHLGKANILDGLTR